MAMEQHQESQNHDKSSMATKYIDNSDSNPETWYKGHANEDRTTELPFADDGEMTMSQVENNTTSVSTANVPPKKALPKSKPNQPTKMAESFETLDVLEKDYRDLQHAYDDSRRDLQSTSRENRDQSLELRDLKRRLAKLQEQNAEIREENGILREAYQAHQARGEKLSKSERNKYNEKFEMLENHISHLQHERHKRETHMEFLTEQTREANNAKERLEAEARKLQRQMRDLSANLTECKDDLLRLQPTSQVSDNEISEQFSNLDQQIAGWIDDQTEDLAVLEGRIGNLRTVDDLPEQLRMFATPDHLRLAKRYTDSQPLLLRYFIHCYLQTFILSSEVYLFGLDERTITLLQGMEEGMKQLEPRRDDKTLQNWRSETLRGLLKMDSFLEEQTRQAKLAAQSLSSALSTLISDPSSDTSSLSELFSQIIQPAITLATALRLSTTDYRLVFHPFIRDPSKATTAYNYEIQNSSMIDLMTHKIIRPDSVLKIADDGRLGEEMLVVSPALVRDQRDGKGKVMVCKPTVLVKLDEPMGRRGRGIKALGAWTPSWLGGDEGGQ